MYRFLICMFALLAEHTIHPCAAPKKDYRPIRLPVEIEMDSWLPALKLERTVIGQALKQAIPQDPLINIVQDYVGDTFDEEMLQFFRTEKWERLKKSWFKKEHDASNIWKHAIDNRSPVAIRNGSVIYRYEAHDAEGRPHFFIFEYIVKEGISRMIISPIYAHCPTIFPDYTAWQSVLLSEISKRDLFSEMLRSECVADESQNDTSLKERIAKKLDELPDTRIKVISVFNNINERQPKKDFLVLPSYLQDKNYEKTTTVTYSSKDGETSEYIDRQSGIIKKVCRNLYLRGPLLLTNHANEYINANRDGASRDMVIFSNIIYNYDTQTYEQIQKPSAEFSWTDYHNNRLIMFRKSVQAFTDDREITHNIPADLPFKYVPLLSIGFEGGIVADYGDKDSKTTLFIKGIDGRVQDQQITTADKGHHSPVFCRFHDNVYLVTDTKNQIAVFKADYSKKGPVQFEQIGQENMDQDQTYRIRSGCSEGIVTLRDDSNDQICIFDFSGLHDQYLDKRDKRMEKCKNHLLTSEQEKFISPKQSAPLLRARLNNKHHSCDTIYERLRANPDTLFNDLTKNFRGYHVNKHGHAFEPVD